MIDFSTTDSWQLEGGVDNTKKVMNLTVNGQKIFNITEAKTEPMI